MVSRLQELRNHPAEAGAILSNRMFMNTNTFRVFKKPEKLGSMFFAASVAARAIVGVVLLAGLLPSVKNHTTSLRARHSENFV
jgi:hypothetical protein